jgi:hypothetical protein
MTWLLLVGKPAEQHERDYLNYSDPYRYPMNFRDHRMQFSACPHNSQNGIVNFMRGDIECSVAGLNVTGRCKSGDVAPHVEWSVASGTVLTDGQAMTAELKLVVDQAVS